MTLQKVADYAMEYLASKGVTADYLILKDDGVVLVFNCDSTLPLDIPLSCSKEQIKEMIKDKMLKGLFNTIQLTCYNSLVLNGAYSCYLKTYSQHQHKRRFLIKDSPLTYHFKPLIFYPS